MIVIRGLLTKFCCLLLVVSIPGCGGGTSGTGGRQYRGTATNQNGQPLVSLNVTLQETGETTRTDLSGSYAIESRFYTSSARIRFRADDVQPANIDKTVDVPEVPSGARAVIVDVVIDDVNNTLLASQVNFDFEGGENSLSQRRIDDETQPHEADRSVSREFTYDGVTYELDEHDVDQFGCVRRAYCGDDGNTYYGTCEIEAAGVDIAYEGSCIRYSTTQEDGELQCSRTTVEFYEEPQCDFQGNRYPNECIAEYFFGVTWHFETEECEAKTRCGYDWICNFLECEESGEVCGFDGVTYESALAAEGAGVLVAYHRGCVSHSSYTDECFLRCDTQLPTAAQVCGANAITYPSECFAIHAGVREYSPGPCAVTTSCGVDPVCTTPGQCFPHGQVCGDDYQTYENDAAARLAGVKTLYHRACIQNSFIEACTLSCAATRPADAVCGVDGKTYKSECFAIRAGTRMAYEGPCERERSCEVDFVCKDGANCQGDDRVCGRDNQTYGSEFEAYLAGVAVAYQRSCIPNSAVLADCSVRCEPLQSADERVCAADGRSYLSECHAVIGARTHVEYAGHCLSEQSCPNKLLSCDDSDCPYLDRYPEVCGVDNITYEDHTALLVASVGRAYRGVCLDRSVVHQSEDGCEIRCLPAAPGDEVCGNDGVTYASECEAYQRGAVASRFGSC